ncbi:MAG: hypothetical protein GY850_05405, partial [bacterium]|nr:hypothetical protein [bacterium]
RVSCAKNKGIKEFSQVLKKELAQVDLIQTTWPKTWFNVKTQLEQMTEHFINYEQYKKMCQLNIITDVKSQDTLVDFLNDLGVIVHFKDFELQDTNVIEPKWITTAVYRIINSAKVADDNGALRLGDLKEILRQRDAGDYDYPRSKHKYVTGLMKKFELCYNLDKETVLVPQLLTVVEPDFHFDYDAALKFALQYDDFLPLSIMPRFIVKRHPDIKGELRWRTGVVLEN